RHAGPADRAIAKSGPGRNVELHFVGKWRRLRRDDLLVSADSCLLFRRARGRAALHPRCLAAQDVEPRGLGAALGLEASGARHEKIAVAAFVGIHLSAVELDDAVDDAI